MAVKKTGTPSAAHFERDCERFVGREDSVEHDLITRAVRSRRINSRRSFQIVHKGFHHFISGLFVRGAEYRGRVRRFYAVASAAAANRTFQHAHRDSEVRRALQVVNFGRLTYCFLRSMTCESSFWLRETLALCSDPIVRERHAGLPDAHRKRQLHC